MKKAIQWFTLGCTILCFGLLGGIGYWHYSLPAGYYVEEGTTLVVNSSLSVNAVTAAYGQENTCAVSANAGESYRASLRWLGLFPVKDISVTVIEEPTVTLGGLPFGIKLYTDGVMVVSLSAVDTASGNISPARNAGLKVGDLIVSINDTAVYTNEQVSELVKQSAGSPMLFRVKRDGVEFDMRFSAVRSRSEQCYKAGMWVRDSSAGIGTLTFYNAETNLLAGLGHAVCDVDTGDIIPISSGELVPARIYGITQSIAGVPGELRGGFDSGSYGTLLSNNVCGVYALANQKPAGQTIGIKLKQSIHTGDVKIYTTIGGNTPQWYDARITQVRHYDKNITRNMVVEITDKTLLAATGGIVQGMSGSPIVQDGKLIGAVTHVLVNDPTKGYGIFIENMLNQMEAIAR